MSATGFLQQASADIVLKFVHGVIKYGIISN